jgi:tetratricopeptide (TPR) repeat protein
MADLSYGSRARLLFAHGKVDEAAELLRSFPPGDPRYCEARLMLAHRLWSADDRETAIHELRGVIAAAPDCSDAYGTLVRYLSALGERDAAIDVARQLTRAKPDDAWSFHVLGLRLLDCERPQEAIAPYETAVALDPSCDGYRLNLGNALADAGDFPRAIEMYRRVLELKPGDPSIAWNLALTFERMGRPEEAIGLLKDWLHRLPSLSPEDDTGPLVTRQEFHSRLGVLLLSVGRRQDAIAELQEALALDPADEEARQALAQAGGDV